MANQGVFGSNDTLLFFFILLVLIFCSCGFFF